MAKLKIKSEMICIIDPLWISVKTLFHLPLRRDKLCKFFESVTESYTDLPAGAAAQAGKAQSSTELLQ